MRDRRAVSGGSQYSEGVGVWGTAVGYGFQVAGEAAEQEGPPVVHNVFGLEALRWLDAGMARRFGTGGV